MSLNKSSSSTIPTSADWEARRAQITRRYPDEGQPLRKVMLEVNMSGFKATVKMYKSRIHKWSLDKKYKNHEARAIVCIHAGRRGKATRIRLRERSVDNSVHSYFKRKRLPIEEILGSEVATPPDLMCDTPIMSPRPMPQNTIDVVSEAQSHQVKADPRGLESPDSYKAAELLFAEVQRYILSSFGTGYWISHGPDRFCQSERTPFVRGGPCDLFREINLACSLFDKKRPAEAIQTLSKGFTYIKMIVEVQSLGIMQYLLRSIAVLVVRQLKPLVLMLCRQLYSMAAIVGPRDGPVICCFRRMFSLISLLAHNNEVNDYLLAALQVSIDAHVTILGACHLQTIQATSTFTRVMNVLPGPENLASPLTSLYQSLKREHNLGTNQSVLILLELIDVHIDCGRYEAAETTAQEILEQTTSLMQSFKSNMTVSLLCHAYSKISYIQNLHGNLRQAEINSNTSRALSQILWGRDIWDVMSPRTCLWELMSDQGA